MIGNAAGTFEIAREEIANLRYLRNPRTAALYLGIPQVQVEDVWAEIPQPRQRPRRSAPSERGVLNILAEARNKARDGSENLLEAYSRFYAAWEAEHGFLPGAGKLLVPAGFQP